MPLVSTALPGGPERQAVVASDAAQKFTDIEDFDHGRAARKGSEVTDSGW
jgi:hypothetical protein